MYSLDSPRWTPAAAAKNCTFARSPSDCEHVGQFLIIGFKGSAGREWQVKNTHVASLNLMARLAIHVRDICELILAASGLEHDFQVFASEFRPRLAIDVVSEESDEL